MRLRLFPFSLPGFGLSIALLVALLSPVTTAHANPFVSLSGAWRGGGQIELENGNTEQIRCRAYYNPKDAGTTLGLSIRCASPGNRIDLRAQLAYRDGGLVAGTWEERTFNATGSASGIASTQSIRLDIAGTLTGTVAMTINGESLQVSIHSSNTGMNGVMIELRRSG